MVGSLLFPEEFYRRGCILTHVYISVWLVCIQECLLRFAWCTYTPHPLLSFPASLHSGRLHEILEPRGVSICSSVKTSRKLPSPSCKNLFISSFLSLFPLISSSGEHPLPLSPPFVALCLYSYLCMHQVPCYFASKDTRLCRTLRERSVVMQGLCPLLAMANLLSQKKGRKEPSKQA